MSRQDVKTPMRQEDIEGCSQEDIGEECSQDDVPPGMAPKMLNLLKIVDKLEKDLRPLISRPYYEVLNKLQPFERAKIGMMEIYTINSLFWVLMRTAGDDVASALRDDYKVEMGRLKETQSRIAEVEARPHRSRVDSRAAARFIKHGLGLNTREEPPAEGDESSLYSARKRRKLQEQANEESSGSSQSEDEEESDGNNDGEVSDGEKNRSWYGKGW